jgi:hypothetical protein
MAHHAVETEDFRVLFGRKEVTDYDAIIERANKIASHRDAYIHGEAHEVLCRLFGIKPDDGLVYAEEGTQTAYDPLGYNMRLTALAFALALLPKSD